MPRKGQKLTEEQRQKRSEQMKLQWQNSEYREKVKSGLKNHEVSGETRMKISQARKGKPLTDEHKKLLSERASTLWQDADYRQRVTEAINSPEIRRKIFTEERNRAISDAKRLFWQNKTEDEKQQILKKWWDGGGQATKDKMSGVPKTDEQRKKMREARRRLVQSADFRLSLSKQARRTWESYTDQQKEERVRKLWSGVWNRIGQTSIEKMVSACLVKFGVEFEQEKQFGPYRVDFYLPRAHSIIECDGVYWHSLPGVPERDAKRDAWFVEHGVAVYRIGEVEIRKNADAAVEAILAMCFMDTHRR